MNYQRNTTNYQKKYYPRRPVKSFQDLEVYQKVLALAVKIGKRLKKDSLGNKGEKSDNCCSKLLRTALKLPVLIATAHSTRFGDPQRAVEALEEAMLACNLAVVYLEEYRGLENKKIEHDFFEEQIKEYLRVRGRIMRLQKSWLRFMEQKKREK